MDKDNQPTPNKTEYKVPGGQALAGDQGRMTDEGQQMTEPRYFGRQEQAVDEGQRVTEADGAAVKHTETDEQFARKLEDNIEEIKATDAAGRQVQENLAKQAPISEDEAKRLLAEEKRLAEIEYKNAQGKSKKTLMIVLVVAAVLCVLGGAFAIAMANRGDEGKKDDQGGVNVEQGGGKDEAQVEGDKDPSISDDALVSLDINDELVQRLYHEYDLVTDPWSDTMRIYADENAKTGKIDEILMANLALGAVSKKEACVGDYYSGDRAYLVESGCYDMGAVRNKIKEMFGREVSYNQGDVIGYTQCSQWTYDEANQELFNATSGCGG